MTAWIHITVTCDCSVVIAVTYPWNEKGPQDLSNRTETEISSLDNHCDPPPQKEEEEDTKQTIATKESDIGTTV